MYKTAHKVVIALNIQKTEEKTSLFSFEKEFLITDHYDKFRFNPKF